MTVRIGRRQVLGGAGGVLLATALAGCAGPRGQPSGTAPGPVLELPRLRAGAERITRITVCTRPFRPEGPRLETERLGGKTIVHNYGHGGSGWSLSWGSAVQAAELALAAGRRDVAVIGCGAIGLTTALTLQRRGARVTIHARELPPQAASSFASGVWSPDSRICLESHATPAFRARWERATRFAFAAHQDFLGLAGHPVEWIDSFVVRDAAPRPEAAPDPRPRFADLRRAHVPDLSVPGRSYAPGAHPFGDRTVRSASVMMFNIAVYARLLLSDFLALGGAVTISDFRSVSELAALPQRTLVNCTGYGARRLFGDETLVPVRGQLARTIPQPEIGYGLYYDQVSFLPRRDGLVFQVTGPNDYYGYGDAATVPDRAEAERAVATIMRLFEPAASQPAVAI